MDSALAWRLRPVAYPRDIAVAVARLAELSDLAWLDGVSAGPSGRFSLIGVRPCAVLEQFVGRHATLFAGGQRLASDPNFWDLWRVIGQDLPRYAAGEGGLSPGWIGYVGFEAARQLERLPATTTVDVDLPFARLGLYDRAIVLDHVERRAWALFAPEIAAVLGCSAAPPVDEWIASWDAGARAQYTHKEPAAAQLVVERPQQAHEAVVRRAIEYIAAGDVYQVNLAHRLRIVGIGDPLTAYARLRHVNPAAYSACLCWSDGAILSVSPELFLRVRGRDVLTRPIKGTRPRVGDDVQDDVARRKLITSAKEAAELAMIVDLHRNDLGRVCEFGSVRVEHPRRVESHPTVFHTVADIVGRLRDDCDALDLLRACFPAGSVTGVPKIRALEIIDELEPVTRGAYTGAIGVLGLDGNMTMNVAIRTLQVHDGVGLLHVGGGIVADSDPTAEYIETLAKGRGILEGLGVKAGQPTPTEAQSSVCDNVATGEPRYA